MTKYQLTKPGGPWDYPTLGFSATNGAILDGTLSTPAISTAPDAYWAVYGGGSAETGITRYGTGTVTPTPEVADGWVLAYDGTANTYTAQDLGDPESLVGAALSAAIAPADTGWRDLGGSDEFTGSTIAAGVVLLRRIGDDVTFHVNPNADSFNGNDLFGGYIPAGFLPRAYPGIGFHQLPASDDTGVATGVLLIGSNSGELSVAGLVGTFHVVLGTWQTSDAWPETLPGSAVP